LFTDHLHRDFRQPFMDGGREGDTITFNVGGILANETATWHSATNE
jgi:hypothetical protein